MKKKTEFPKALKLGPTGATHSASALFTDSWKSYPHPNSFCVFSPDNDLPSFTHRFLVKNRSCSECLNLSCASNCLQNTLALIEGNIFRCSGISEGVLALSHKIYYLQTLLAPNVGHFCLSNKCSSNTRWCGNMSFYLPFTISTL